MSKKTCDNDLRDVKAELSVCQEDLLFTNGSLTTCNSEISNKDLIISNKKGKINLLTYNSFVCHILF